MAEVIRMPKMSDTMEEGVIASWLKKVGDEISAGDIIAEVETDKATMELESYEDGTLLHIGVQEKDSIPVNGVIAVLGQKGENIDALLASLKTDDSEASEKNTESISNVAVEVPVAVKKIDTSGINANLITMPKMSDTMTEGIIASWLKSVGDEISSGDILAEVETDKATMELESYEDGILLHIGVEAGNAVAIDGVLAVIGEKGADYQKLIDAHTQNNAASAMPSTEAKIATTAAVAPAAVSMPIQQNVEQKSNASNGRLIKASPLAKKMASDKGYNLADIVGTGDGGRVIKRDIESFIPKAAATAGGSYGSAIVGQESTEEVKVSQMRKVIAKRLSESKFSAPHFYLTMEIDMDRVITARKSINEVAPIKISYNDIIVKATAAAIKQHPMVNASWAGDAMVINHHINIGVAVAVPDGLVVPVVKFADSKSLAQISGEIKELGAKARDKKLHPDQMQGNTFTISNLGMFGIDEFTAIINAPDACILAVGGIKATPVIKNGEIVPGNIMKVTLSCDHRVVDGAVGSAFLKTFKEILQDPVRILI